MPKKSHGRKIDAEAAREVLRAAFAEAEESFRASQPPKVGPPLVAAADRLFQTNTQSYREALIGCALARILDPAIDVRKPYVNQGQNAFSGRQLDENVVNPFLHDRQVPCSKGPYLATFRRGVQFLPHLPGQRDTKAYAAFLRFLTALEAAQSVAGSRQLLCYLLYRFVEFRDRSQIVLSRVKRLSLEQFDALLQRLLAVPSKGLLPMLLARAMLDTIKKCFSLDWTIEWQGLNVADQANQAGGDITIRRGQEALLIIEVTERSVDRTRIVKTFGTKISPHGIEDYLFLHAQNGPTDEARVVARQYFGQGHDISFLPIRDWLVASLGTVGVRGRSDFIDGVVALLETREVPAALKVAWNDHLKALFSS